MNEPHARPAPPPDTLVARLFAVDVRTLALVRVALGAVVLADLTLRLPDLATFHSDAGLLPRAAWLRAFPRAISLHAASGSPAFVTLLFALHAAAAIALVVGYRTRTATFASWLLTVSLAARNPALLQAGDNLLGLLLFWGMFAPLGAAWSLDAAAAHAPRPRVKALSLGTAALVLQMPVVYFTTGLLKDGPEWRSTFTAIEGALSDDFIASAAGLWLGRALPATWLQGMTAAVLAVELLLPLALMSPVATSRVRLGLLPALFVLQAGFLVCLRIGLFPFISTAGALALLPSEAWDRLEAALARGRWASLGARVEALAGDIARRAGARPARPLGRVATAACAAALVFAALDDVGSVAGRFLPEPIADAGRALHLGQSWRMFVRASPSRRWVVLDGTLANGSHVDLLAADGSPPSAARPDRINDTFASYRWRKYLGRAIDGTRAARVQRRALAAYLCRAWDESRGGRLVGLTAVRFDERVGARAGEAPMRRVLFEKTCPAPKPARPAPGRAKGSRVSQR
jgi:hypothetical protein